MTILNQTEIMVPIIPEKYMILAVIALIVGMICAFVTLGGGNDILMIIAFILVIGCFITCFVGSIFEKSSGRYQYECLIDDTVTYTEIYNKYDVVEQRGSIWVLEDKEK